MSGRGFFRAMRSVSRARTSPRFTRPCSSKDGRTFPAELNAGLITYQGRPADLVFIRDITERKKAEEALKESQARLSEAMDIAHLVNWEFDVPTGIFTFDDRFYALYGTTAEREGGTKMPAEVYAREFCHPDDVTWSAKKSERP